MTATDRAAERLAEVVATNPLAAIAVECSRQDFEAARGRVVLAYYFALWPCGKPERATVVDVTDPVRCRVVGYRPDPVPDESTYFPYWDVEVLEPETFEARCAAKSIMRSPHDVISIEGPFYYIDGREPDPRSARHLVFVDDPPVPATSG